MKRTTSSSSIEAAAAPEVLLRNDDCCAMAFGNFMVVLWNGGAVGEHLAEVEGAVDRVTAAYPGGLSMLLVVRDAEAALDARASEETIAAMKRAGQKLLAFCAIVPGSGDKPHGSRVSVETRTDLSGATRGPSRFFEQLEEGTDWLESYLEGAQKLQPPGARLRRLVEQALALYPPKAAH